MENKNNLKLNASNIEVQSSTNAMYVIGCICTIGDSSVGSLQGAGGKKIIISQECADKCIKSFVGQPMNCVFEFWGDNSEIFTSHGDRFDGVYFGFIQDAWQEENRLMAKIVVWKEAFPELASTIINAQRSLGFSVEFYPTQLHEENDIVIIDEFEGVGCALLWRSCAAFGEKTYIDKLVASLAKKEVKGKGDVEMTEQEMKQITSMLTESMKAELDKVKKDFDEKISGLGIEEVKASIEEMKKEKEVEVKPKKEVKAENDDVVKEDYAEKLQEMFKAEIEKLKEDLSAKQNIPAPKAFKANEDLGADETSYINRLKKIDASNADFMTKLKQKAQVEFEAEKAGVSLKSLFHKM